MAIQLPVKPSQQVRHIQMPTILTHPKAGYMFKGRKTPIFRFRVLARESGLKASSVSYEFDVVMPYGLTADACIARFLNGQTGKTFYVVEKTELDCPF
jgi:hypothetical protein